MAKDGQEIRSSQALHTYGPGAIADFPELSVMILSHDVIQKQNGEQDAVCWGEDYESPANKLEDERLSLAFNVEFFVAPPKADSSKKASVRATRFPTVLQCPQTGQLYDSRDLEQDDLRYTDYNSKDKKTVDETFRGYDSPNAKKRKLIPVRFVIATEDGFLDNFPFDWYVHTKNNKPEQIGKGNKLYLKSKGNTASLKTLSIESYNQQNELVCRVSLERIFDQEDTFVDLEDPSKDYLQFVAQEMPRPWLGRNFRKDEDTGRRDFYKFPIDDIKWPPFEETTSEADKKAVLSRYPRTLQRGAGNLYFPIIYKGISIPKNGYSPELPEDFMGVLNQNIKAVKNAGFWPRENEVENFIQMYRDTLHVNFKRFGYSLDQGVDIIRRFFSAEETRSGQYTIAQLREQEFKCFLNPNIDVKRNEWYDSKIIDGQRYKFGKDGIVRQVVLLNKVRELKVFRGFTRIKPLMFEDLIFESLEGLTGKRKREAFRIQDPRIHSITPTLPATEVKGEGIFIQFENEALSKWEDELEVKERFNVISKNNDHYRKAFELEDDKLLSPRFVALHTFSHLLINELSIECGYGSSSLSEIIYCSPADSEFPMNGVLIYTSSSDSEGTLGGLVEKGEANTLNSICEKALSKALWCSSDPLCMEDNKGKGFMAVNLAACHSCALLPETSCSNMNKFLDRGLVIGTLESPELGLFSKRRID